MKLLRTTGLPVLAALIATASAAEDPAPPRTGSDLITVPERTDRQKTAQAVYDQALKAFTAGDLSGARIGFQKVLALAPSNAPALINLSLVDQRARRYDDAERNLRRLLRDDPKNGTAWLLLGIGAYEQGQLDAALAHLAQSVLYSPKDARAHQYFGVTLSRRGWYVAGEEELRRAIELDPKFADAHFNLASLYVERIPPATELARRHYQKALELGAAPDASLAKRIGD
jgi:Flp pilus assembly protein TadD